MFKNLQTVKDEISYMNIYDEKGVGNLIGAKQSVTRCVYKHLQTTPLVCKEQ